MNRRIIYDDDALDDLVEQHAYLMQQAGGDVADSYVSGLLEATERAAQWLESASR